MDTLTNHAHYKNSKYSMVLSQDSLSTYPYSIFTVLDKSHNIIIKKSPWEIICDEKLITTFEGKDISMICAAAVNDRIKYELLLHSGLQDFVAIEPKSVTIPSY